MSHIKGVRYDIRNSLFEIKQGHVPGYSLVHKFGRSDDVANNVWSIVSLSPASGAFPSSGSRVNIRAGGNVADSPSGLGARSVTIVGINTDLEEVNEILITAGADASAMSTNTFWRLSRAYLETVGQYSNGNIGDIILENSAEMLTITAGEGQTQHAAYSIPAGKTGFLITVHLTIDAGKAADVRLMTRENFTNVTAPFSPIRLRHYWDGVLGEASYRPMAPGIELTALTDIWIEARGGGQSTEVSADFELLLIDDDPGHIQTL